MCALLCYFASKGITWHHLLLQALGDLVESCVGAILLDSGFNLNKVWKIMTSFLDSIMKFSSSLQLSPVRDLRELCQSHNLELEFLPVPSKLTKRFSVEAKVSGNGVCETASATGQNKKEACRIASLLLFSKFKVKQLCLVLFFPSLFSQLNTLGLAFLYCTVTPQVSILLLWFM